MSGERNVSMEIYGRIEDYAAVEQLANQMVGYVSPDWNEGRFPDEEAAIRHIAEAVSTGTSIHLVRHETGEDLDWISEVCRKFDLSYRIKIDGTGHDAPATAITWTKGMLVPAYPDVDSDFQATITISELRELLDQGIDAVEQVIERKAREALIDIDDRITASESVTAALRGYTDEDDAPGP